MGCLRLSLDADLWAGLLATSTDAERAFSHSGLTVTKLRHSLADESVRSATLLASWSKIKDLITEATALPLLQGSNGKGHAPVPPAGEGAGGKAVDSLQDGNVVTQDLAASSTGSARSSRRVRGATGKASSVASGSKIIELD